MQLAKTSLTLLAIVAAATSLSAAAQVAPSMQAGQPASLQAPMPAIGASGPAVETTKPTLNSASVEAVPMGTSAKNAAMAAGTMRELETLQRQTALAEMRKRLSELGQQATPVAGLQTPTHMAPGAVSPQGIQTPNGGAAKSGARRPSGAGQQPASHPAPMIDAPRARVVNVLLVAGRARADVLQDGRLFTIKEGDGLAGRWVVASISPEGVMVERRKKGVSAQAGARGALADSLPGGVELMGAVADTGQFDVVKLEPVSQFELSQAIATTTPSAQPTSPAASLDVPPSPTVGRRPDSTTTAVIPPLPSSN